MKPTRPLIVSVIAVASLLSIAPAASAGGDACSEAIGKLEAIRSALADEQQSEDEGQAQQSESEAEYMDGLVEKLIALAHDVALICEYAQSAAGANGSQSLCYPVDLVPLACASASSSPARQDATCIRVYPSGDTVCDYVVTAGGSGSGMLAAGEVRSWAFDQTQTCDWLSLGGSCSTGSWQYLLPAVVNGSTGCATTTTVTRTTFFAAQAQAVGNCYS